MTVPNQSSCKSIDELVRTARRGGVARRDFLRRAVLLGLSSSAAYQLLGQTDAAAQNPFSRKSTMALGEEGPAQPPRDSVPVRRPGERLGTPQEGKLTTFAVGEESSQPPKPRIQPPNGKPTTLAVGEEGRPQPTTLAVGEESPVQPTTKAIGEESPSQPTTLRVGEEQPDCPRVTTGRVGEESSPPPRPTPTTLRVGEENSQQPPSTPPQPAPPQVTTFALGEEGTPANPPQSNPPQSGSSGLLQRIPRPWKNFRRW